MVPDTTKESEGRAGKEAGKVKGQPTMRNGPGLPASLWIYA